MPHSSAPADTTISSQGAGSTRNGTKSSWQRMAAAEGEPGEERTHEPRGRQHENGPPEVIRGRRATVAQERDRRKEDELLRGRET